MIIKVSSSTAWAEVKCTEHKWYQLELIIRVLSSVTGKITERLSMNIKVFEVLTKI